MFTILCDLDSGVHARAECYPDKVVVRAPRKKISATKERVLRKNCARLKVSRGRQVDQRFETCLVELYRPNNRALQSAAKLGPVSELEIALDIITPDFITKYRWKDRLDRGFVQNWHRNRRIVHFPDARYSGPKISGHRVVWYVDRPAKVSWAPHCLHIEGRYLGVAACRRVGIQDTGDLIDFDHVGYWQNRLQLFEVDMARLGRFDRNKHTGQRRRSRPIASRNGFSFDADQSTGRVLFHIFGEEPGNEFRSVQGFVNAYGRGPYLRRIEGPLFISNKQSFHA